jgi:hypothetical protein
MYLRGIINIYNEDATMRHPNRSGTAVKEGALETNLEYI